MRAIAVRQFHAEPELLDLPNPTPGAGELLVKVSVAGINPFDWKIADGALKSAMPHQFPLILGTDAAGTVVRLGEGASQFAVGDRVYGQFLHPPVGTGTYCEWTTVPEANGISRVPSGMDDATAAALPTAGMTALYALDSLGLSKGQTLLIVGASGGVGSFAVQLATLRGIRAIAVVRTSSVDYVRALGAAEAYAREETTALDRLRAAHPGGVDALLDLASDSEHIGVYAGLVRAGGIVSSTVHTAPPETTLPKGTRSINFGLPPSRSLLDRFGADVVAGRVRASIGATISLEKAPQALTAIRSGLAQGKTVIRI